MLGRVCVGTQRLNGTARQAVVEPTDQAGATMQGNARVPVGPASASRATDLWLRTYFRIVSLAILLLVLIAFSDNLFTDIGQPSNKNPVLVVHGLFALAWTLLFFLQAALVGSRNLTMHRSLGAATFAVALGVVISTLWLFVVVWTGWDAMPFHVKANRMLLPAFAIAVALALHWRRKAHLHKRLILIATLYMLLPVNDRAAAHLGIDVYVFNIVVWNALWLSLLAYDKLTTGRLQPVSLAGFALFYAIWMAAVLL
jgi:hypothetical protein